MSRQLPPEHSRMLRVDAKVYSALHFVADLPLTGGLALIGPNGSGKSTLLHAISGILPIDGTVSFGDRRLDQIPSAQRGIGYLDQKASLFPHLNCTDNVAFPLRARGMRRTQARKLAKIRLGEAGLSSLVLRMPDTLSGGQAQQVALLRALAAKPQLLLLDEPFSSIDLVAADRIRTNLRTISSEIPLVLATHSIVDASDLCAWAAVVNEGQIAGVLPTDQLVTRPPTAFAAQFAGVNILPAGWSGTHSSSQSVAYTDIDLLLHTTSENDTDPAGKARISGLVTSIHGSNVGLTLVSLSCQSPHRDLEFSVRVAIPHSAAWKVRSGQHIDLLIPLASHSHPTDCAP